MLKKAEILIFVSAWASPYNNLWELMLKARAAENELYVVGVNRTGKGLIVDYCGFSMIVNPKGSLLKVLGKQEGFLTEKINKNSLYKRRKKIPWLNYRVPKLYLPISKVNHLE